MMMKRIAFILLHTLGVLVLLGNSSTVLAQSILASDVPTIVLDSLYHRFPQVKVKHWEREDSLYVAHIRVNGVVTECAFSEQGVWVETETSLTMKQLPLAVKQHWTTSEFAHWTVVAISMSQSRTGDQYEIEVRKGKQHLGLHYDAAGTLLRSEKE